MKDKRVKPTRLTIKPNHIHIWFAFPDEIADADLLSDFHRLLIPEERQRQERFRIARHRHQYLVSRTLIRTTLSRYTGLSARSLRFSQNKYGKPELETDSKQAPVRFNLSHTDGLIALAVGLTQDIGVDVENIYRRNVSTSIANRYFSSQEARDLYLAPKKKRRDRFFDLWTLKESYIKAKGMGLSLPLAEFSFHFLEESVIRISFAPGFNDNPDHWCFWLLNPTDRHKVALSVCSGGSPPPKLSIRKAVPLIRDEVFDCPIAWKS